MKKLLFYFMLICAITISHNLHAQNTSISDNQSSSVNELLLKYNYHQDLPEYKKAKEILELLISEKSLSEAEIKQIFNEMMLDPTPVKKQYYVRFHDLPVYINSGNPEIDKENYKNAKDEWIKNNPEKYNNLIK